MTDKHPVTETNNVNTDNKNTDKSTKNANNKEELKEEKIEKIYEYDYLDLHNDLENNKYIGGYGGDHCCYLAIAEKKAQIDLQQRHSRRTQDEFYIESIKELLENKQTQTFWKHIVTFDPLGMFAKNPTISATEAIMNVEEIRKELIPDDKIVDKDGGIHIVKAGIHYAWNLPALAKRLELTENDLRDGLHKYTENPNLVDKENKINVFLPAIGGITIYMFGDVRKIRDPTTQIALRVHDECNGSDVFGSDICTCRPYLIFAIKCCVDCAQRGGVGIIAYFRREGRGLGEVNKFRIYNARQNQKDGDCATNYFYHTEKIVGIRDARFQTMITDALHWLGIDRIDWFLSMSNDKYEVITKEAGIRIGQRVPLPDVYVPKNALGELTAKLMSNYNTNNQIKSEQIVNELRDLRTIRKRCGRLYDLAKQDKTYYFKLHEDKIADASNYVFEVIKKNYPDFDIPLHSRFRHFQKPRLSYLIDDLWTKTHRISKLEQVRRLIDLVTVSVLLDAGAGPHWRYIDKNGIEHTRSEGLAVATFDMFVDGIFSSDPAIKTRVNSIGLQTLSPHQLKLGMQVSSTNPMDGIDGRCGLLQRLGAALEKFPQYFGAEIQRPGHLIDYVIRQAQLNTKSNNNDNNNNKETDNKKLKISIHVLWKAVVEGFEYIWPERVSGIRSGDVWSYYPLKNDQEPGSDLIPFHKLQQWLVYSIIDAIVTYYGELEFENVDDMTGLAEYRNGGLFMDTEVLTLKNEYDAYKYFDIGSELVVEWRALTIILCDKICDNIRTKLNKTKEQLPLSSILEGGIWRAGRELAYKLRNGKPPLNLRSDGTVF